MIEIRFDREDEKIAFTLVFPDGDIRIVLSQSDFDTFITSGVAVASGASDLALLKIGPADGPERIPTLKPWDEN